MKTKLFIIAILLSFLVIFPSYAEKKKLKCPKPVVTTCKPTPTPVPDAPVLPDVAVVSLDLDGSSVFGDPDFGVFFFTGWTITLSSTFDHDVYIEAAVSAAPLSGQTLGPATVGYQLVPAGAVAQPWEQLNVAAVTRELGLHHFTVCVYAFDLVGDTYVPIIEANTADNCVTKDVDLV